MGDSLTASHNGPGWVRRACTTAGAELVCEAAQPGLEMASARAQYLPAALAAGPDVCVILVGTNDVARARLVQPLRHLLPMWRAVLSRGHRLVAATLPPHERLGARSRVTHLLYNQAVRACARALASVELVDLTPALGDDWAWAPCYRSDTTHPNSWGKARMAAALTPVLRSLSTEA